MDFEIAFGGEAAAAHVASERPFARVRSDVNLQSGIGTEHLAAVSTAMLEKRFVSSFAVILKCHFVG